MQQASTSLTAILRPPMLNPIIEARNLSKRYHLGVINRQTLQDEVRYWWHKTRGRNPSEHMGRIGTHNARPNGAPMPGTDFHDEFWALRDVSFTVQRGEILGIIGRNGAGKSTLLKILSRITEPTQGEVVLRGRVGSLLEVGTGFHPELTGRENIYLNGTILGMKKREIDAKFDEIVAFAEVEKFLDTPVKRYSSGMYVRLAFAIAAHLEPEILIVDEVLAVGDVQFQRKCLGKMEDVAGHGRTVLFVSHSMPAIRQLCRRSILFQDGTLALQGPTNEVIDRHLETDGDLSEYRREPRPDGKPQIVFARLDVNQREGVFWLDIPLVIWTAAPVACSIEMVITDRLGFPVGLAAAGLLDPRQRVTLSSGANHFQCRINLPHMAQGAYNLTIQIAQPWVEFYDKMKSHFGFKILRQKLESTQRPLEQKWGYGNLELALDVSPASPGSNPLEISNNT
jgi:lipopolysaccharide transport system ATP-binding protein